MPVSAPTFLIVADGKLAALTAKTATSAIRYLPERVVAVLDATKWGRAGLASFARLEQIQKVITDSHAPAELVAPVREAGVEVILA